MTEGGKTTKKGEIHELKAELNSLDKSVVKDAVKKVIASMTIGKDVSSLFTDVLKSMQTESIELKKLVYLYIINYARSQPDKAILIVNTFQKDANSSSPLIRALAIRTMGCIRVDRITEYLCEPLAKACRDKDPYVRKTAAIGIAKLYDINRELVEEQGFITKLKEMISDANPMVIANAVAALAEIDATTPGDVSVFQIDSAMLSKLLAALNECTEWGQVFILDALASYRPDTSREAEEIVERVTPRLKHANSAVSMSAIKVIIKYLTLIDNQSLIQTLLTEKLPPPLITLLSEHKPEIQYVALRNINLIVQRQPLILSNGVKHFFCKYNDPIYVKMEKLEIMIQLASVRNCEKVLQELREYASEVDIDFVRKAVLAIGRCAIKIEQATERCIAILVELIQTKVNYVVQEAICVIKDIFRKYPNKYESIISVLCENLESLDESDARAAMIWIIGEYSERIDNSPQLLQSFTQHFDEETSQVQLTLLTAVVKLFLKRPEDAKQLVGQVLNLSTAHADSPDLRDRGYVYWRLLSSDPEAAQRVVLAQKPLIRDDTFQLEPKLLATLCENISTLASIFHKPPEMFVKDHKSAVLKSTAKAEKKAKAAQKGAAKKKNESESESDSGSESESSSDDGSESESGSDPESSAEADSDDESKPKSSAAAAAAPVDLLNLGGLSLDSTPAASKSIDLFGGSSSTAAASSSASSSSSVEAFRVVLTSEAGKGLQLRTRVARRSGTLHLDIIFDNKSQQPLQQFAIKFNDNFLGLQPTAALTPGLINVGESKPFALPIVDSKAPVFANPQLLGIVQIAIKTELGVFYFNQQVAAYHCFSSTASPPTDAAFIQTWKSLPDSAEQTSLVQQPRSSPNAAAVDSMRAKLAQHSIHYIASRITNKQTGASAVYFAATLSSVQQQTAQPFLIEIKHESQQPNAAAQVCVKSESPIAQTLAQQLAVLIQ